MHPGKKNFIIATASTLIGGGALLAIGIVFKENAADKERKPALVDQITAQSMIACDTQESMGRHETFYEARLRGALNDAFSDDLDFIIDQDITICLDQRIGRLSNRFFENAMNGEYHHEIQGLYYPKQRVLALYDDGIACSFMNNFMSKGACYHSLALLEGFSVEYNSDDLRKLKTIQQGSAQKRRKANWRSNAEQNQALQDEPDLIQPPLRHNIK